MPTDNTDTIKPVTPVSTDAGTPLTSPVAPTPAVSEPKPVDELPTVDTPVMSGIPTLGSKPAPAPTPVMNQAPVVAPAPTPSAPVMPTPEVPNIPAGLPTLSTAPAGSPVAPGAAATMSAPPAPAIVPTPPAVEMAAPVASTIPANNMGNTGVTLPDLNATPAASASSSTLPITPAPAVPAGVTMPTGNKVTLPDLSKAETVTATSVQPQPVSVVPQDLGVPMAVQPGTVPSVAPMAPGAQPKPVTPAPVDAAPIAQPKKQNNVVMYVLIGILVVLMIVAAGLWYLNSQGISLFGGSNRNADAVVSPSSVAEASGSGTQLVAIDTNDACYVNPNTLGQQEETENFITWVHETFTDIDDTDGFYAILFAYYLDRAYMASGNCNTHQYYCHTNFATKLPFAVQFAQYDEQINAEQERGVADYTARIAADKIRDNLAFNFNLDNVDLSDVTLDEGSGALYGLNYDAQTDTVATYGPNNKPVSDYTYEFVKAMSVPATGQIMLVGQAVASPDCVDAAGCACEASQIYILMAEGPTGDLYYADEFVEPLVGKTAVTE